MLQIPDDMESATAKELWEKSDGLPVWRKICFAIGGAPYQITSTVLGFFMSIFLLEVAQVIHVVEKIRNPYSFQIYMILNCISVFLLVTREFNVNKIQMFSCLLLDQYYQLITSVQNLRFMVLLLLRSNHPMCP